MKLPKAVLALSVFFVAVSTFVTWTSIILTLTGLHGHGWRFGATNQSPKRKTKTFRAE
jgi:hypothetical protein